GARRRVRSGRAGAYGTRQPRAAESPQRLTDRGGGPLEDHTEAQRSVAGLLAPGHDLLLGLGRQPSRPAMRRRATIGKRRPAALPIAPPEPVAGRTAGTAGGR